MRRSFTYQGVIGPLVYTVLYILYSSLSSIYLFLPPLFSLLFFLFVHSLRREHLLSLVFISFALLVFEANYGEVFFSTIFYFYIATKFLLPKIEQSFNCYSCIRILYVLLAYIGYFLFLLLISQIFLLPIEVHISYYMLYYIIIEFFLVSLL